MGRNARQPERLGDFSFLGWAVHAAGDAIARNPLAVGGCTAFLVTLSYVSANALWYQPHFHQGAFFSTRQSMHHQSLPGQHVRPKPVAAMLETVVWSSPLTLQRSFTSPVSLSPCSQKNWKFAFSSSSRKASSSGVKGLGRVSKSGGAGSSAAWANIAPLNPAAAPVIGPSRQRNAALREKPSRSWSFSPTPLM